MSFVKVYGELDSLDGSVSSGEWPDIKTPSSVVGPTNYIRREYYENVDGRNRNSNFIVWYAVYLTIVVMCTVYKL